jgi:hypothetical protein
MCAVAGKVPLPFLSKRDVCRAPTEWTGRGHALSENMCDRSATGAHKRPPSTVIPLAAILRANLEPNSKYLDYLYLWRIIISLLHLDPFPSKSDPKGAR